MATYLLAWELGAGTGHCVNLLPIAKGLIAEGHEVYLAARDLAAAKRVFQDVPVNFLQAPYLIGRWNGAIRQPETFAQILHNTGFGDFDQLQTFFAAWKHLYLPVQPDTVICEHAPIALLTSRFFDVRRYVIGTGFFSPPDLSPLPTIRPEGITSPSPAAVACEEKITERINRLLIDAGKQPFDYLAQLYATADANFLTTYAELDHYRQRNKAEYEGNWSPLGGVTPDWPEGTEKKIFAYLQPPSKTWQLADLMAFLIEMQLPTVAYVPGCDPHWLQKFQCSTLTLVTERVDIRHAAEQCDLAILNGNAGTSTALLLAGVPQLLIPLHLEQAVYSQRVVELGAGIVARPDRPANFTAKLMQLLASDECKSLAELFALRYAEQDANEQLQSVLQQLLMG